MRVVVPFSADDPLTRLAPVLDSDERRAFALAMLGDVLDAVERAGGDPELLATRPVPDDAVGDPGCPVTVDDRSLSEAVNAVLADAAGTVETAPVAVVMADLALATPAALRRLFDAGGADGDVSPDSPDSPDGDLGHDGDVGPDGDADAVPESGAADVVIAPGRGGGTNALVVRDEAFRVDYHGASYRDHRRICEELGADVAVVDSFRLATDVDEPADLVEVLLHTDGRAADWLDDAGFAVETGGGRVRASRD